MNAMSGKKWSRLGWLLLAVGLAAALLWAYRAPAVAVAVTAADRGPLEVVVEEEGRTRIRERFVVAAPVAGYMQRVALHAGDEVRAGDVLFTLEPLPPVALDARARAEAEARVTQAAAAERAAQSEHQAAAADADFTERERARLRPLFDTGQIARTQYDRAAADSERARAALDSARARVDVAQQELRVAQIALRYAAGDRSAARERVAVRSPSDGVVLEVQHEDEGVVASGQPVLAVGDRRSLEIVVEALSADAVRLATGMTVWLERWGGAAPLEARVRRVEPTAFTKVSALGVEEQRVEVVADLVSPAPQWRALGDGYRVEARFVLWRSESALRVPHSSLVQAGDGWAVFVVDDGRARLRPLVLGQRGAGFSEVSEGLAEGDWVVTYPDDRLDDGVRVQVRERE